MDPIRTLLSRCTALFGRQRLDADLDEELRAHIDLATEENIRRGIPPQQARTAALRDFGGVTQVRESYRQQRGLPFIDVLFHDLRFSLRGLRKSPGFAATVIARLALGIGATTAIFSVMNAVLMHSMPVPYPQQLVYLHVAGGQPYGAHSSGDSDDTSFSQPVFEALRQDRRAFSDVMAFAPFSGDKVAVRIGSDSPEQASGEVVSGNFFSGLGVAMALGRSITLEDEQQHSAVATLSYAYWARRFSKDPSVLGRVMYIKGIPFTITGIAANGFPGVEPGEFTDFWIPLQRRLELNPWGSSDLTLYGSPDWWCIRLIARLAPGVSAKRAVAQASPAFQAAAYATLGPPTPGHPKVTLAFSPAKGIQGLGDNYREPITILMALVTLVLLIACSNVAMLIVARNAARQRDFSLRMALGAQRRTLLRQLLAESSLLVLSGSLLGWLLAIGGARALAAWAQLDLDLMLGIPLLQGRDILDSDIATSPRVAIVNETFVKKLLPNTNPLGHQLADSDSKDHPYTIVGVDKDSKYRSVDEKPRAMAYYPYTQGGDAPSSLQVELRTSGDPLALQPSVERALREIDPDLPLEKPMTQAAVFENSYSQSRVFAQLSVFLGLLAALLVAIGLYGTLSYCVNRRSVEIGVRMALGARRQQVLSMVLREAFQVAAFGIAIGIPLALLTAHLMGSMLFALQPYDAVTLSIALLGVVGISLATGYIPARRAASMNPMRALRSE